MKLFKSKGFHQQVYRSKHNDVTAFHAKYFDISAKEYVPFMLFKLSSILLGRFYYRVIKYFFDNGPSKDLTPTTLYQFINSTGLSRYVRESRVDLKFFENLAMKTGQIELDHINNTAHPKKEIDETDEQAMDRVQRACFLAVPIHYHSFVHFHAPTAMAIYADTIDRGKLRTLLKRHTRYTLIYNNGGITASSSDFFCKTLMPDYSNKRASDSIVSRVQQYWDIKQVTNPELPPARSLANENNFTMNWLPSLDSSFSFDKKIMSFYPHIQCYVDSQNLDLDELIKFNHWLSDNIYPIPQKLINTTIPLIYLIWSNSVVHSLEHAEYYKWKAYARYGAKTTNDSWYRYFMNIYAKPYGSFFRNEKLSKYIPAIKALEGAEDCYTSIQF